MPDGSQVVHVSLAQNGKGGIYRKPSDGSGQDELTHESRTFNLASDVSPDGKEVLLTSAQPSPDVFALPLTPSRPDGPLQPRPVVNSRFNEFAGRFSPDGKWMAYVSNESGRNEIFVTAYPGLGGKRQISTSGGTLPRWRRDGKELYYLTATGDLMAAEVGVRGGSFEVGTVEKLFSGVETGGTYRYDVSLDGKKFLLTRSFTDGESSAAEPPLTFVENWPARIRR